MTGEEMQVENGDFTRIHNGIMGALYRAKFNGQEFQVLLFLLRKTYGWNKKEDQISLGQWTEATGILKPNVSTILTGLERKHVVYRKLGTGQMHVYGFNKYIEQWDASLFAKDSKRIERMKKHQPLSTEIPLSTQITVTLPGNGVLSGQGTEPLSTQEHTKDSIKDNTKDNMMKPARGRKKRERTPEEQAVVDRHKAIMEAYRTAVGYPLVGEGAENKAAHELAKIGYNPEQVVTCYKILKDEPFWESRHLGLASVAKQIGAMLGSGHANGTNGTGPKRSKRLPDGSPDPTGLVDEGPLPTMWDVIEREKRLAERQG